MKDSDCLGFVTSTTELILCNFRGGRGSITVSGPLGTVGAEENSLLELLGMNLSSSRWHYALSDVSTLKFLATFLLR